ncbi:GTPase [Chelatococcus reniformis]|uniref:IRG-type G domain-containing protein n=1 Tax=Chelatococcus reniformis TaxID=1494448 RepID=A0A916X902_9HYPH|nr:GTPase [Chelatococcus reniformis]GGC53345.1 hypothetical protein GCM10010994_10470 [Chelatococcus reniformis]
MVDSTLIGQVSLAEAAQFARRRLEERERERLTIALVGRGGAGKSSLINKLVGRKVCEVGVSTDKTQAAHRHEWGQVIFIDLPGYGTREFTLDRVMTEFGVESFDMFLWCASGKFLEEDLSIHETIAKTGKPIIFVRTHCDTLYDEEKSDEELEAEITEDLQRLLKRRVDLLFVSANSRYPKFRERLAKLTEAIVHHAREAGKAKAEIVYRDFQAFTDSFLKKKREAVEEMVTMHSLIAAANGINPVPGMNVAVDIANVTAMLNRVSTAYDIDQIAKMKVLGDPPTWLLGARGLVHTLASGGVVALLKAAGGPALIQQVGRYVPVFGMAVSAGLGFLIVRRAGLNFIEDCHRTAEQYLNASGGSSS